MLLTEPCNNSSHGLSKHPLPATINQQVSNDALPPKAGPGFIRLNSTIYRLEMLLMTIAILAILFYWRLLITKDLNLPATVFWIIWPDLASLIPIGIAMRNSRDWPSWGPTLYNLVHTFLLWISVFAIWNLATSSVQWPLLGWAGHITADRSVGYYLRANTKKRESKSIV